MYNVTFSYVGVMFMPPRLC